MRDAPVVLGVNRTQDASICLMHGSEVVCAIQKERLTRQKHHWGKLDDFRKTYLSHLPDLNRRIVKWRWMEYAVDVCEMVRNSGTAAVRSEGQCLCQFLLVGGKIFYLCVR